VATYRSKAEKFYARVINSGAIRTGTPDRASDLAAVCNRKRAGRSQIAYEYNTRNLFAECKSPDITIS
jgi:uridine phosphorylase